MITTKLKYFKEQHPVTHKIVANISWLFFDKLLRLGLGLIIIIWLARYLGPEQFGLLNFIIALIAVFSVLSTLGLNIIVVRDLVNHPNQLKETLGSAFILKLSAAVVLYVLSIITITLLRPEDNLSRTLVAILGLSLLFQSSEVIKFWFESQVQSKFIVWTENSCLLITAAIKIIMLWQEAPLIAFVYIMLFESALIALALFYTYSKKVMNPINWNATKSRSIALLEDSWPLIISSAAWIIYTRVDQIMIGQMIDDQAVGYYSAAIKLSEVMNFLPLIIVSSIIPTIMKYRETNPSRYTRDFQRIYDLAIGSMLFIALATTLLSSWIIQILFGPAYEQASSVLTIHIWSAIFIAMATVSGRYLINEGLQKITMTRHILGVIINIPLNYIMIPIYGIQGAAISTLIALAASSYFFDLFHKETKLCFKQKTLALLLTSLFSVLFKKIRTFNNE